MNVSVISAKKVLNLAIYKLIIFFIIYFINLIIINSSLTRKLISFEKCSIVYLTLPIESKPKNYLADLRNFTFPLFYNIQKDLAQNIPQEEQTNEIKEDIPLDIKSVAERNIEESYNYTYNDIKIKNQSNYNLSEDMFSLDDINFNNKKIIIYHTHTCESYTPSEKFNYTMTGNYRTTDNNYNVVRVGEELKNSLNTKGFSIIHNTNYHDYPSYNGSYERSYETIEAILNNNKDAEIIIDLHRDAVGDGSWYGPTVNINGKNVAQMMFVIRYRWRRTIPSKLENKLK